MSKTFVFSCTKAKNELVAITKKQNIDIPTPEYQTYFAEIRTFTQISYLNIDLNQFVYYFII
jgi:hypothetical protein